MRLLLKTGLNPNACNKFGESIIHAVCRRGDHAALSVLLEYKASVCVSDDFGRTPLHDACWTSEPNFDLITMLLDQDPWLLCLSDCRGSTPLSYVRRNHWALWIGFLSAVVERYWPCILEEPKSSERSTHDLEDNAGRESEWPKVPPRSLLRPNSHPIPDPQDSLSLEVLELLASGMLNPADVTKASFQMELTECSSQVVCHRRITMDPNGDCTSNATMMQGLVHVSTTGLPMFK